MAEVRYQELHRRLSKYFEYNRSTDPEHCADITIDRAVRKISEGTPVSNLSAFLFGIAKLVLKESQRTPPSVSLRDDLIQADPPRQAALEDHVQCLEMCLRQLKPDLRDLFVAYYGEGSRAELAAECGITLNALRIRILTIKATLRSCLSNCLREQPA